jgi:hypothetical protein
MYVKSTVLGDYINLAVMYGFGVKKQKNFETGEDSWTVVCVLPARDPDSGHFLNMPISNHETEEEAERYREHLAQAMGAITVALPGSH